MTLKLKEFLVGFFAICSLASLSSLHAQEVDKQDEEAGMDPALKEEIAYVEALTDAGLPAFADEVIVAAKKKWADADALFFALEVRNMLMLGKSEEVTKKIGALPQSERNGPKYWAARLEVANDHYSRNRKDECLKIYDEFFSSKVKTTGALSELVRNAHWQRSQLLIGMKLYERAAADLESVANSVSKDRITAKDENVRDELSHIWCNASTKAAELYLLLAEEEGIKPQKRKEVLEKAKKIISKLLWERDKYVFFGSAIAMKAHLELLLGNGSDKAMAKAQSVINDYMDALTEIHGQLEASDPTGRLGHLKLSPMPQCRYLLAEMLWKEVKKTAEAKEKSGGKVTDKETKNKIGDLLLGAKNKSGKRNNAGAYNHAVNVFARYSYSPWATKAEKIVDEIEDFMMTKYGKQLSAKITPEQRAQVRINRFNRIDEIFTSGEFEKAINEYYEVLAEYPESKESITAISNIISSYYELLKRTTDQKKIYEYRIYIAAIAGYLAERFPLNSDNLVMITAGNAVLDAAAKEKQFGAIEGTTPLYYAFVSNYTNHVNAATVAVQQGCDAFKAEDYQTAIKYLQVVDEKYPQSTFRATALTFISQSYEKMGDKLNADKFLEKYISFEDKSLPKLQAMMKLAIVRQKNGFEDLNNLISSNSAVTTNQEAAVANVSADYEKARNDAIKQIVKSIVGFSVLAKDAEAMLNDPNVSKEDREKYQRLYEISLYYPGVCWNRLIEPAKKIPLLAKYTPSKRSTDAYQAYVDKYPKGEFAKNAYLSMSSIFTVEQEIEKSKNALDALCRNFPDSDEARTIWPMLAKTLVEYAQTVEDPEQKKRLIEQSSKLYSKMIKEDSSKYNASDLVRAGQSLVRGEQWSLADEAFDKAISKLINTTNQYSTLASARLGKAMARDQKGDYASALDELNDYLNDEKLSSMHSSTNACLLMYDISMNKISSSSAVSAKDRFAYASKAVNGLRKHWRRTVKSNDDPSKMVSVMPEWKLVQVEIMAYDITIARAENEAFSDTQAARKIRLGVATDIMSQIKIRKPITDAENPADNKPLSKFLPQESDNLEELYERIVRVFSLLGAEQSGRTKEFANEYLAYFPKGKYAAKIANYAGITLPNGNAQTQAPQVDGEATK